MRDAAFLQNPGTNKQRKFDPVLEATDGLCSGTESLLPHASQAFGLFGATSAQCSLKPAQYLV